MVSTRMELVMADALRRLQGGHTLGHTGPKTENARVPRLG